MEWAIEEDHINPAGSMGVSDQAFSPLAPNPLELTPNEGFHLMERHGRFIVVAGLFAGCAHAQTLHCPTLPGTSVRDYSAPCYRTEGNLTTPTLPGNGVRDYSKPGYRIDNTDINPTLKGSSVRDYSRPGYRIEGNMVNPTLPGTNVRDYSKPGMVIEGDMTYPTLPGSSVRDYSKPGVRRVE